MVQIPEFLLKYLVISGKKDLEHTPIFHMVGIDTQMQLLYVLRFRVLLWAKDW